MISLGLFKLRLVGRGGKVKLKSTFRWLRSFSNFWVLCWHQRVAVEIRQIQRNPPQIESCTLLFSVSFHRVRETKNLCILRQVRQSQWFHWDSMVVLRGSTWCSKSAQVPLQNEFWTQPDQGTMVSGWENSSRKWHLLREYIEFVVP